MTSYPALQAWVEYRKSAEEQLRTVDAAFDGGLPPEADIEIWNICLVQLNAALKVWKYDEHFHERVEEDDTNDIMSFLDLLHDAGLERSLWTDWTTWKLCGRRLRFVARILNYLIQPGCDILLRGPLRVLGVVEGAKYKIEHAHACLYMLHFFEMTLDWKADPYLWIQASKLKSQIAKEIDQSGLITPDPNSPEMNKVREDSALPEMSAMSSTASSAEAIWKRGHLGLRDRYDPPSIQPGCHNTPREETHGDESPDFSHLTTESSPAEIMSATRMRVERDSRRSKFAKSRQSTKPAPRSDLRRTKRCLPKGVGKPGYSRKGSMRIIPAASDYDDCGGDEEENREYEECEEELEQRCVNVHEEIPKRVETHSYAQY